MCNIFIMTCEHYTAKCCLFIISWCVDSKPVKHSNVSATCFHLSWKVLFFGRYSYWPWWLLAFESRTSVNNQWKFVCLTRLNCWHCHYYAAYTISNIRWNVPDVVIEIRDFFIANGYRGKYALKYLLNRFEIMEFFYRQ